MGSGTTTAAAHKLGRKWIGVEFGEHFEEKTLTRMKNVLNGDNTGITKNLDFQGGGFFKYYTLEQYEDTLKNAIYKDENFTMYNANKSPYEQYIFFRDEKLSFAVEGDETNNTYSFNPDRIYPNIDLPESLSNLIGERIISKNDNNLILENNPPINLNDLDLQYIKPLIRW